MTGLLTAGWVEKRTGQKLLQVIPEGKQIPLEARVVGEIPDVAPPKWWRRARREAEREVRERRWWPPEYRDRQRSPGLPYGSGWPVGEPLWTPWSQ